MSRVGELQEEFIFTSIVTFFSNKDEKRKFRSRKGGDILLHVKDTSRARSQSTKVRQIQADFFKYAIESL